MGYDARIPVEDIGPARRAVDAVVVRFVDWAADAFVRHWLLLANGVIGVFAFLPFLAPYLVSIGQTSLAQSIYVAYSYTCHQMPSRSWFLFGQQMAWCERDTAIWVAMLLAGLTFGWRRGRQRRLSFRLYLLLIAPMAIDGFTQAFGWRESTWLLRTLTGTLFGAASVYLTYPYLQRAVTDPRLWE